jgi:hypothetical protein
LVGGASWGATTSRFVRFEINEMARVLERGYPRTQTQHWQAIERLQHQPSAEHAQAAKRAFRFLALRLHPDQGGSHEEFVRLRTAYDRALAAWRPFAEAG